MIVINGKTYLTTMDAALDLGVSTKTVRTYIQKGVIPQPPTIKYGIRTLKHFPPEYIKMAKQYLENCRAGKTKECNRPSSAEK